GEEVPGRHGSLPDRPGGAGVGAAPARLAPAYRTGPGGRRAGPDALVGRTRSRAGRRGRRHAPRSIPLRLGPRRVARRHRAGGPPRRAHRADPDRGDGRVPGRGGPGRAAEMARLPERTRPLALSGRGGRLTAMVECSDTENQFQFVPAAMPTRASSSSSRSRKAEASSPATAARETLSRWIAEKGLKATRQREIIVDTFFSSSGHLSVDELLAKVQSRDDRIGAATVYRTMKILADSGLASARHFDDGQTRYEAAIG